MRIDRIDKDQRSTAEVAIPFAKIPRRDRCSRRPPSSLSATNRHNVPSAPNSHKKRHGGGASSDFGTHGGPSSSSSSSHSHSSTIRKPGKLRINSFQRRDCSNEAIVLPKEPFLLYFIHWYSLYSIFLNLKLTNNEPYFFLIRSSVLKISLISHHSAYR